MATSYHCFLCYNNTTEKRQRHIAIVFFFFATPPQKETTITFFFFSNTKRTKHIRKQQKNPKRREGAYLQGLVLLFHFWLPFTTFGFQTFSPSILFFSSKRKENKNKENKTIEKKRNVEKGGNFLSSSHSALSLLAPTFALLFQMFFPGIFFFSSKRKGKKIKEKKNHKEKKKNVKKEGSFPSSSYSTFSLLAPASALLF
jgi:hypothetical protein